MNHPEHTTTNVYIDRSLKTVQAHLDHIDRLKPRRTFACGYDWRDLVAADEWHRAAIERLVKKHQPEARS